jgi:16S rRNA (guanine(966)-N(2))-methyltransferase RsmD
MRIISGKYKGRRITAPKKLPVRPTTDMAKEALFNILNNRFYFNEIAVLELFAGTGNISYEFASRGTEHLTAVDADAGCIQFIDLTSKSFEFNIRAIRADVFSFLEKTEVKADLVFADPPYDMPLTDFEKIPSLVFAKQLLLVNGLLIIEHGKHMSLAHVNHFSHARKYGGSVFSFFETSPG